MLISPFDNVPVLTIEIRIVDGHAFHYLHNQRYSVSIMRANALKVTLGPTRYAVSSESITGLLILAFVLLHSTMLSRKNPALLQGVQFDTLYYTALSFETHLLPSTRIPGICITF